MNTTQSDSQYSRTSLGFSDRCSCVSKQSFPIRSTLSASSIRSDATRDIGLPLYELLAMTDLMRESYVNMDFSTLRTQLSLLLSGTANLASALSHVIEIEALYAMPIDTVSEDFDVVELLQEVTQTARLIVGNKPVTIMDAASPKPFFIHGDRGKIKKIMMEIIINAAKFTHRGRVAVIIAKEDDRMRMTVTDTGIGMSTEHIRAFFPSAENKKEEVSIGMPITGSGLLIARSLVNLLKGSITASSKLKEGTIVEVSLPIKQQVARIHTLAHAQ